MNRKVRVLFLILAVILAGVWCPRVTTHAEDWEEIDYSFLTTEEALVGTLQGQTRGTYLVDGTSSIAQISNTKIGVGGSTTARRNCKISVAVIVEKLVSGSWGYYASWQVSDSSDTAIMTARSYTVPRGYSYRVRCTHRAGSDASSSWTGALKMS